MTAEEIKTKIRVRAALLANRYKNANTFGELKMTGEVNLMVVILEDCGMEAEHKAFLEFVRIVKEREGVR